LKRSNTAVNLILIVYCGGYTILLCKWYWLVWIWYFLVLYWSSLDWTKVSWNIRIINLSVFNWILFHRRLHHKSWFWKGSWFLLLRCSLYNGLILVCCLWIIFLIRFNFILNFIINIIISLLLILLNDLRLLLLLCTGNNIRLLLLLRFLIHWKGFTWEIGFLIQSFLC
jgi:hypothetical protein